MSNYNEAVSNFISKNDYLSNSDVLGIVLYGSYTTGYNHDKSDIDMHIIMSDNIKEIVRGVTVQDGFKIEYFEKPLSDLYKSADNDYMTHSNALLPIIGNGVILFDRNGDVLRLQNYIFNKYKDPLPPLSGDDAIEMAVIIENRITQLEIMFNSDRVDFNHNYHLLIEKIRKFYSRICGCADIPVAKAVKIYTDEEYRKSFCKSDIPDEEFIHMYFNAISCDGTNEEKMNNIYKLYDHATKTLQVDPNHYRILIKSRNNPLNKNHE